MTVNQMQYMSMYGFTYTGLDTWRHVASEMTIRIQGNEIVGPERSIHFASEELFPKALKVVLTGLRIDFASIFPSQYLEATGDNPGVSELEALMTYIDKRLIVCMDTKPKGFTVSLIYNGLMWHLSSTGSMVNKPKRKMLFPKRILATEAAIYQSLKILSK